MTAAPDPALLDTNVLVYAVITRWAQLLRQNPATKKRAFDTQLVATMLGNGVTKIYTFNTADFQHFTGIQVLVP